MKIGAKLMIIITAVNIICIGGLVIGSLTFTSSEINTLVDENARAITSGTASQVGAWMDVYLDEIRVVGQLLNHFDNLDPLQRRSLLNFMLKSIAEENPRLLGVWAVYEPNALDGMDSAFVNTDGTDATGRYISYFTNDGNGNVLLSALRDYDNPGTPGAYYNTTMKSGKEAIIEPYNYNINGKNVLMTSLTVPIMRNGRVVGVAGVDLDLGEIQTMVSGIKPFGTGAAAVFSHDGIIIAHPDPSRLGRRMAETESDFAGTHLPEFVQAVTSGTNIRFSVYSPEQKSTNIVVTSTFNVGYTVTPWSMAIAIPEETVMKSVNQMTMILIIFGIVIMGIITLIIYFISRTITMPLKSMETVFAAVGEGDFTKDLAAKSKDEIGNISRSFNGTLVKIRKLIMTIKNQASQLSEIGNDLASNMTETAAAVNEITANTQNIKNRVLNQSASVTETNATMEQMTLNIEKLSVNVDKQRDSVSQSSSAIEQMFANINSVTQTLVKNMSNVKNLADASEVGRSSLQEVATDIQEISRESEGLLEINSVMENIAGQTNLLSMNAAIEAAHAGDAGKGFAVVADEIRKLAESSGEQSKTISTVLKKIKDSIDKISKSTENVLKKFELIDDNVKTVVDQEESIRNSMEEQGSGSKQILESVGLLNELTQQVKSGADEMLNGSKEVISEGKNLQNVTEEITGGMNEMATGAEQINSAVNQINEISGKNKDSIDILVTEVSKFKAE